MLDQIIVFGVLGLTLVLFIVGRWRYDVVALMALLVLAGLGIVPGSEAFLGFGHPAVVTVAAVLVLSRGLRNAGLVDLIATWMARVGDRPYVQVTAMTGLVAVCSSFMNNVGALALLMPVALRMARQSGNSPSILLMPMAFGSILGGMTTMIGTPPNIIIASLRTETGAAPFRMFDFSPVGVGVALAGVVFVTLAGWRLIPKREGQPSREDLFRIEDYITEVRVTEGSSLAGKSLRQLGSETEADVLVIGIIRDERREFVPSIFEIIRAGDILIVEAASDDLNILVQDTRLELVGSEEASGDGEGPMDVGLGEAIVLPNSDSVGWTARSLNLRQRYGINLLAVARRGERLKRRLNRIRFKAGDVVLLQGREGRVQEAVSALGWLPLAERGLRLGEPRRIVLAVALFALAVICAARGLVPASVAFVAAAVAMRVVGLLSLREIYQSIDWPIIVLLGALIPVGNALDSTGGAQFIADQILRIAGGMPPALALIIIIVGAMTLSDVVNNAAAAVLVAPIAISLASGLGVSADPFLMAVAIGCSCAFLTPIGHQSNTLVMGPGGYKFGDYWRMGLPLEIIIVAVSVPLILTFWPM